MRIAKRAVFFDISLAIFLTIDALYNRMMKSGPGDETRVKNGIGQLYLFTALTSPH
jgi:hypothetical protein